MPEKSEAKNEIQLLTPGSYRSTSSQEIFVNLKEVFG